MPRPAQPTPGVGPPDSTQSTPPYPSNTMSSSLSSSPFWRSCSSTVGMRLPPISPLVESALGSQPTCITR